MRTLVPIAIGLCAAAALIAGLSAGERYFRFYPLTRRQHSAVFALMSAVSGASCVFLRGQVASRHQAFTLLGMLALSAMFAWAALGTAGEWPGFRPEINHDEIEEGVYDDELDG